MCNLSSDELAKIKEIGRAKGLAKGYGEVFAEVFAEGFTEGFVEGLAEECAEIIRSMLLENDLTVEKIAKYAKVTVEEVRKIQAEMKNEV